MQNFNHHSHTYRCGHADIDVTDEDYVKDYIKMGFKKVTFTDHCPEKNKIDTRPNIRMEYDQRKEYLNSIKTLKHKYSEKIEIETGYEIEYLPNEEDNLIELKNETDKIILGQHFIYGDDRKLKIFGEAKFTDKELIRYAKYISKAIELNIPDIVAHPDIFMVKRNNFGNIEEKIANIICSSAEKYNIPLEINLNNIFANTYYENRKLNNIPIQEQRMKLVNVAYPSKQFWRVASNYNLKVLYGIDAHHKGQILLWNELIELANEIIGKEILKKLNFIDNNEDI